MRRTRIGGAECWTPSGGGPGVGNEYDRLRAVAARRGYDAALASEWSPVRIPPCAVLLAALRAPAARPRGPGCLAKRRNPRSAGLRRLKVFSHPHLPVCPVHDGRCHGVCVCAGDESLMIGRGNSSRGNSSREETVGRSGQCRARLQAQASQHWPHNAPLQVGRRRPRCVAVHSQFVMLNWPC